MMKKFLSLALALVMVLSLVACGGNNNPPAADDNKTPDTPPVEDNNTDAPETPDEPEDGVYTGPDWEAINAMNHEDASEAIYEYNMTDFYDAYMVAKEEVADLDLRLAKMAVAEAKMLETGAFIPLYTDGGNYAMSRVVPKTTASVHWGLDSYRYQHTLVCNELIKNDDVDALKGLWGEAATADEYYAAAKAYLEEHGYTLKRDYTYQMDQPETWDILHTSQTSDSNNIIPTMDLLMEYDCKSVLQPALATSYDVSEDGTVYTFHIREGVKWVDQQGRELADVQADDWVAAVEHLADNPDELGFMFGGDSGCNLVNFDAYVNGEITDFSQVGVKALDKYTLEYTLTAPFPPFITMVSYSAFAPLCRSFYESQGGKFGAAFDASAADYQYGKSPANIAYCGPYLITNYTETTTVAFKANPTYWNKDTVTLDTVTLNYYDGTDPLKTYNDTLAGTLDGCGFNANGLEQAKKDIDPVTGETYFDAYNYTAVGGKYSYSGWFNLNRQAYTNVNDTTKGISSYMDDDAQKARTKEALSNANFRLAIAMGLDRGSWNAQSVGEDLKYVRVRNSYCPGNFTLLTVDTTVDINGTATTFPAGTWYGAIMQAQLDADGCPLKVWDPTADGGAGSGDGFDGWYDPANAKEYLNKAIEELAQVGVEVSAENPILIDFPGMTWSPVGQNQAQVVKQSVEASLEGKVIINVIEYASSEEFQDNGYRAGKGNLMNYDLNPSSGWGPDYGDPQTFLDTMLPYGSGYMTRNIGMW